MDYVNGPPPFPFGANGRHSPLRGECRPRKPTSAVPSEPQVRDRHHARAPARHRRYLPAVNLDLASVVHLEVAVAHAISAPTLLQIGVGRERPVRPPGASPPASRPPPRSCWKSRPSRTRRSTAQTAAVGRTPRIPATPRAVSGVRAWETAAGSDRGRGSAADRPVSSAPAPPRISCRPRS